MIVTCSICSEVVSKYKCSKCKIPYCSLSCWNRHKVSPDCVKVECQKTNNTDSEKEQKWSYTEDTVPVDRLASLERSENLKTLLKSPQLRELLRAVDETSNPAQVIHQVMLEPIFVEFADECLKLVEAS